jgi:hypothetical protein
MEDKFSITFYVDKVPIDEGSDHSRYFYCHSATKKGIDANLSDIHTTSLVDLSFELIDKGYDIFVVKNGRTLHCYPGMNSVGNKDIRYGHNLMKLVVGGYFDKDFGM